MSEEVEKRIKELTDHLQYRIAHAKQLQLWLNGQSVETDKLPEGFRCPGQGECTVDFSCCQEGMETDIEKKIQFVEAFLDKDAAKVNQFMQASLKTLAENVMKNHPAPFHP